MRLCSCLPGAAPLPLEEHVPWDVRYRPGLVQQLGATLRHLQAVAPACGGLFSLCEGQLCPQLAHLRWRGPFHPAARSFFRWRGGISRATKARARHNAMRHRDIRPLLTLFLEAREA